MPACFRPGVREQPGIGYRKSLRAYFTALLMLWGRMMGV